MGGKQINKLCVFLNQSCAAPEGDEWLFTQGNTVSCLDVKQVVVARLAMSEACSTWASSFSLFFLSFLMISLWQRSQQKPDETSRLARNALRHPIDQSTARTVLRLRGSRSLPSVERWRCAKLAWRGSYHNRDTEALL